MTSLLTPPDTLAPRLSLMSSSVLPLLPFSEPLSPVSATFICSGI